MTESNMVGLGGIVFIIVTLICLFLFNLSGPYSILIGVVGAVLVYFIGKGMEK